MKVIIFIFLSLVISGCSFNSLNSETSMPKIEKQVLQKGLFVIPNCTEENPAMCLCEADITYPVISGLGNEVAQLNINHTFKTSAEEYKCDGIQTNNGISTSDSFQMKNVSDYSYKVTLNSPEILSIISETDTYGVGAAHPNSSIEGFIIDVKTGSQLSGKDIFGKNIEKVNQLIYEKLVSIEYPDLEEIEKRKGRFIEKNICHDCSLSLSKEGVTVIFTTGSVAPVVAGNPEILIPNKYIEHSIIANP